MSNFSLTYTDYLPEKEGLREALCTLGNGYFATRGAAEESSADGIHYPGTYIAGGYNRLTSKIRGRAIVNEDLVNFPNWLPLSFRIGKGPWFHPNKVKLHKYKQELDLKKGVLKRTIIFEDQKGRKTRLATSRFVNMAKPHYAGIEWKLTPENWAGEITLRSGIDGGVQNLGVKRYRNFNSKHLNLRSMKALDDESVELVAQTNQSLIEVAIAARTRVFDPKKQLPTKNKTIKDKGYIGKELTFKVKKGKTIRVEKIITLFTSKDPGITEPSINARLGIKSAFGFEKFMEIQVRNMEYIWEKIDIKLKGRPKQENILRLHIFHLVQTVSPNTVGFDAGVPARGLHGEAYRGHIFWDELFIFPIYNYRYPQITRSLLLYRYHRLDMARILARHHGYHGAMFPWQSGSDGSEETQTVHLNPLSGRWLPDKSHLQRHVNLAIAFNIWQYYSTTDDITFLENYGAEMYLEILRFWSSIITYNSKKKRYEILSVMGPDEYHEEYPGSEKPGLNNNAYTNVMVAWLFRRALDILNSLPSFLREKAILDLGIGDQALLFWKDITQRMFVPFHGKDIISQFEGYEKLKEFDWKKYKKKYGNIERLDRILESENDSPNNYKLSKQADVLMLFYLLPYKTLKEIFRDLAYPFNKKIMAQNIAYYNKRTSHGSTLSKIVSASILNRLDRNKGWHFFKQALVSDIEDVQGGTTSEGIHLGAMAGTVDIVIRDFTGLEIRNDTLYFDPQLPETLNELEFQLKFRRFWIKLIINHKNLTIAVEKDGKRSVSVAVRGKKVMIQPGVCKKFKL